MGGALDLLEVHSKLLDQPQKKNGSALSGLFKSLGTIIMTMPEILFESLISR